MIDTISPALSKLDDAGRAALFTEARTANTFAATPVSDAELSEIWDLAKWAPTAANIQPLRVLYVRPGQGRERLVEAYEGRQQGEDRVSSRRGRPRGRHAIPRLHPHSAAVPARDERRLRRRRGDESQHRHASMPRCRPVISSSRYVRTA